ncbi:relaxase/mobilization nuclease domain-containing protein [Bradyrhizobium elkanii]|uniref:relaxase/mobilization nuclease domain-containing protein n=1 Tax=Bradyrhizobium elkanii TaxID=29448 RepID=UPI003519105C
MIIRDLPRNKPRTTANEKRTQRGLASRFKSSIGYAAGEQGHMFGHAIEYATTTKDHPRSQDEVHGERVIAVWSHGLTSQLTAAAEMEAVASKSSARDPVTHAVISYDTARGETPTIEQMKADVERWLRERGYTDGRKNNGRGGSTKEKRDRARSGDLNQHIAIVHGDKGHIHIHVIANRVARNGVANNDPHTKTVNEHVAADIARERGWEIVLGRMNMKKMLDQSRARGATPDEIAALERREASTLDRLREAAPPTPPTRQTADEKARATTGRSTRKDLFRTTYTVTIRDTYNTSRTFAEFEERLRDVAVRVKFYPQYNTKRGQNDHRLAFSDLYNDGGCSGTEAGVSARDILAKWPDASATYDPVAKQMLRDPFPMHVDDIRRDGKAQAPSPGELDPERHPDIDLREARRPAAAAMTSFKDQHAATSKDLRGVRKSDNALSAFMAGYRDGGIMVDNLMTAVTGKQETLDPKLVFRKKHGETVRQAFATSATIDEFHRRLARADITVRDTTKVGSNGKNYVGVAFYDHAGHGDSGSGIGVKAADLIAKFGSIMPVQNVAGHVSESPNVTAADTSNAAIDSKTRPALAAQKRDPNTKKRFDAAIQDSSVKRIFDEARTFGEFVERARADGVMVKFWPTTAEDGRLYWKASYADLDDVAGVSGAKAGVGAKEIRAKWPEARATIGADRAKAQNAGYDQREHGDGPREKTSSAGTSAQVNEPLAATARQRRQNRAAELARIQRQQAAPKMGDSAGLTELRKSVAGMQDGLQDRRAASAADHSSVAGRVLAATKGQNLAFNIKSGFSLIGTIKVTSLRDWRQNRQRRLTKFSHEFEKDQRRTKYLGDDLRKIEADKRKHEERLAVELSRKDQNPKQIDRLKKQIEATGLDARYALYKDEFRQKEQARLQAEYKKFERKEKVKDALHVGFLAGVYGLRKASADLARGKGKAASKRYWDKVRAARSVFDDAKKQIKAGSAILLKEARTRIFADRAEADTKVEWLKKLQPDETVTKAIIDFKLAEEIRMQAWKEGKDQPKPIDKPPVAIRHTTMPLSPIAPPRGLRDPTPSPVRPPPPAPAPVQQPEPLYRRAASALAGSGLRAEIEAQVIRDRHRIRSVTKAAARTLPTDHPARARLDKAAKSHDPKAIQLAIQAVRQEIRQVSLYRRDARIVAQQQAAEKAKIEAQKRAKEIEARKQAERSDHGYGD